MAQGSGRDSLLDQIDAALGPDPLVSSIDAALGGVQPARQLSPGGADREDAEERDFQQWYAVMAATHDLNPEPDGQFYDYRAAKRAGAEPDASGHWPSTFKLPGHPTEVVGGFHTRTGERVPGTPQASEAELVTLGWSPAAAKQLTASTKPPATRTLGDLARDANIIALKGAIGIPEAAVGIADLATALSPSRIMQRAIGGPVGPLPGQALEQLGFDPGAAREMLEPFHSEAQQQANRAVSDAEGFVDTAKAVIANPSVIPATIGESLPSMLAGGVVGRTLGRVAPTLAKFAGGIGEGTVAMGSAAEQMRQQTGDLTTNQAALAATSGLFTGAISAKSGQLADRLGIIDVDTLLARAAASPEARNHIVRRIVTGAVQEGLFEEFPQSVQEQVLQNAAQGKPLLEGVDQAAVLGFVSGGVMGGGVQLLARAPRPAGPSAPPPAGSPPVGPPTPPVAQAPIVPPNVAPTVPPIVPPVAQGPIAPAAPPQAPSSEPIAPSPEPVVPSAQDDVETETAPPAAVPDSVLSAFPNMNVAEGGLLPLSAGFTSEEQAALRAAGLVETATTTTGSTYEGVDPEKLWPLRQKRSAEVAGTSTATLTEEGARRKAERDAAATPAVETETAPAATPAAPKAVEDMTDEELAADIMRELEEEERAAAGQTAPSAAEPSAPSPDDPRVGQTFTSQGITFSVLAVEDEQVVIKNTVASSTVQPFPIARAKFEELWQVGQVSQVSQAAAPPADETEDEPAAPPAAAAPDDDTPPNLDGVSAERRAELLTQLRARAARIKHGAVPFSRREQALFDALQREAAAAKPPKPAPTGTPQVVFQKFKSALSRAVNAKDWPAVIAEAARFKAYYDDPKNPPYPDDWARWERAGEDAALTMQREQRDSPLRPLVPKPAPAPPQAEAPAGWSTTQPGDVSQVNLGILGALGRTGKRAHEPGTVSAQPTARGWVARFEAPDGVTLFSDQAFETSEEAAYATATMAGAQQYPVKSNNSQTLDAGTPEWRARLDEFIERGRPLAELTDAQVNDRAERAVGPSRIAAREERTRRAAAAPKETPAPRAFKTGDPVWHDGKPYVVQGYVGTTLQILREGHSAANVRQANEEDVTPRSAPATTAAAAPSGISIHANVSQNGIEVKFAKKPAAEVIEKLKNAGFRWAKSTALWYKRRPLDPPTASNRAPDYRAWSAVERDTRKLLGIPEPVQAPTTKPPADLGQRSRENEPNDVPTPAPPAAGSFKVEVFDGKTWSGNSGLRFATQDEAAQYADDLLDRWSGARDSRVVASTDAVSYRWDPKEGLVSVKPAAATTDAASRPGTTQVDVRAAPPAGSKSDSQAAIDAARAANKAERARLIAELKAKVTKQLNSGIDPETVVLLVKLFRTLIADGILDFREAMLAFHEEYGDGARAYDRAVEVAWQRLTKEKVSVETALQAAPGKRKVELDGPNAETGRDDADGGRLRPDRGVAADGDRAPSEGALGTLPAEDGGGAEPAGPDGARPDDSEGLSPDGLPDREAPGGEAGTASGPSLGTVPGPALPISGAVSNPGPVTHDYQLTPERIAAIIGRGDMTRARDNIAALQLIKALVAEKRHATAAEQDTLAKYVGWGATAMADFLREQPKYDWRPTERAIWQEIRDSTTDVERAGLIASSPNAHFTYDLYGPIWTALEAAGFTGGRVLEPAVGTGHAFGFMPAALRAASTLVASELDPITAAIAQALYPSARVQASGYENARFARGTQDLVISNVPFGAFGVIDRLLPAIVTKRIHNYFFAKALEHVRPGGLVVFVTSHYTMDAQETTGVRRYLMKRAHFVGAVRLSNTAFDKTAKTKVITDVIVLRRFAEGETVPLNGDAFIESGKVDALSSVEKKYERGKEVKVEHNTHRSDWYRDHPDLILGEESMTGRMYGGGKEYTVTAPDNAKEAVTEAFATALAQILPADTYTLATSDATSPNPTMAEGAFNPGEYRVLRTGGKVSIQKVARDGTLVDVPMTAKVMERVVGMVGIRDALRATIAVMRDDDATDAAIKKAQAKLSAVYKRFVADFGLLNDKTNRRIFKDDPESTNLTGLERIKAVTSLVPNKKGVPSLKVTYRLHVKEDDDPKHRGLADIFTKRTINASKEIQHADTPADALLASLGSRTRIDWPYMARIYSGSESQVAISSLQQKLVEEGRVFKGPDGVWVMAEEYLSGDVVTKLSDAQAMAADDDSYAPNVKALLSVIPAAKTDEDLITGVVAITLGSHWVPPSDVRQFLNDELGYTDEPAGMVRLDATESFVRWDVRFTDRAKGAGNRHELAVPYGPQGGRSYIYGFTDMIEDVLNLNTPSLGYYVGSGKDREYVKDVEGTLAARGNVEKVREKWLQWVYEHPDVQTRLLAQFNERYNRTVTRTYEAKHLETFTDWNAETKTGTRTSALPGLSLPFPLFIHQLRAIWRTLVTGNTLLAHEVGAGKTFEMIAIAMEMRRTGRARKPMITVPTHLLPQWRDDVMKAYPAAKILAFDEKDLASDKRQAAMARIAFGDWDIVLVPHSSFQLLKVSDARMAATMQGWVNEIIDAEREARAARGGSDLSVKKLAAARKRIEEKIAKKLAATDKSDDRNLTWEQLGVDALLVDEAHSFKNLFFFSKIDSMRGLSRSEADKSLDILIKIQDINETSNYRNLVLATATPVMNSMAEIFTMQRYLQPQKLREHGVDNFDNWYAMFAAASPGTEQQPDGTYKEVMRLRDFHNLNLLYRIFADVMDYVGWQDMPYLVLPKLVGGKITVVETEPHPMYETLRAWFTERMGNIRRMPPHVDFNGNYIAPIRPDPLTGAPMPETDPKKPGPYKLDNILTIMNDARLAAVDVRLVLGNRATDFKGSRLQTAARAIAAFYKQETAKKGAALVFLDVGTPKKLEPLEFLGGAVVDDDTDGGALGVEDEIEDDDLAGDTLDTGIFNLYDALKRALVALGIPSKEIAYIHQARNSAERLALFEAVQQGVVRVMFASTDKGGVGMNIQERLGLEVEFDAPRAMRPGDIKQRHGRIIRQGNTYKEAQILRYVTKGSTDVWLYGALGQKGGLIEKFMRGEATSMRDEDPSNKSIEEAQIRASGDPRGIELLELRTSLPRLASQAMAQQRAKANAQAQLQYQETRLAHAKGALEHVKGWMPNYVEMPSGGAFAMTLPSVPYTTFAKAGEANTALIAAAKQVYDAREDGKTVTVGRIGGLHVEATYRKRYIDVLLSLDLDPLGEGDKHVAVLEVPNTKDGDPPLEFGAGRNVVGSLLEAYRAIGYVAGNHAQDVKEAEQAIAQAKVILARKSDAVEKAEQVRKRVAELEAELNAESAAKNAAQDAASAARAAAGPAAPTAPKPDDDDTDDEGDDDGMADSRGPGRAKTTTAVAVTTPPRTGAAVGVAQGRPPMQGLAFPELVALARELAMTPSVVKAFRGDQSGDFNPNLLDGGKIRLHAALFRRTESLSADTPIGARVLDMNTKAWATVVDQTPQGPRLQPEAGGAEYSPYGSFHGYRVDIAAAKERELAAVLAHEIGHLIDWLPNKSLKRGNLLGRLRSLQDFLKGTFTNAAGDVIKDKTVRKELQDLSDAWRPWDPTTASESFITYRHSSKELYADALSVLLNDPGRLEAEAPTFYAEFFAALDAKPEVHRVYLELQELVSGTPEELIARRRKGVREMSLFGDAKALDLERLRQAERQQTLKDLWLRLRIEVIDRNTALIDRVKAMITRGVRINPDDDPRYALEERNYLGGKLKAFTERHFLPIYQSLTSGGIDWHTFGEALFYERIIAGDRSELANPKGLTPTTAQELRDDLDEGLDSEQQRDLSQAITDFRRVIKDVAEQAYEAGLYTEDQYKQMQANPAYVAFRVIDHMEADVTSRVYRQIGTLKDVQNTADATILKVLATLRAVEQQRVKVSVFQFLARHFAGDIAQAKEVWRGKGLSPIESKDKQQELITYYEKGRLRGKYVDPYIAASLTNESIGQNLAILAANRWINSKVFRPAFTTLNLGFQTFNVQRDFFRFWKNVPTMTFARAVKRYRQAVPMARIRAFGPSDTPTPAQKQAYEDLLDAEEAQILAVTFNDLNAGREVEDSQIEDVFSKLHVGGFGPSKATPYLRPARALFDWIRNVGDFIETLPKAAAIYEFGGTGSIADLTAAQKSDIRRKVGSPDWLMGGKLKPITNEFLLFSNAITQGIRADLEVARDPVTRAGYWWKTAGLNVAPKLIQFAMLYGLAAVAGGGDDDDEGWFARWQRAMRGISEYDLTNYISVPLGLDAKGNAVYWRIAQDDMGRLVGGLTWKVLQTLRGDKDAMASAMQVFDYTAGQFPGVTPLYQFGKDVSAFAAGGNVHDSFRNRFLFTDDELKAGGWRAAEKFIGYEFQQLGGAVLWKFYAGEQRPRDRTTLQVILDLPILSNIVGRSLKVTNFGEVERLRETQATVQKTEARARLDERDAVNDALRQYQRLAPPARTPAEEQRLARGIVAELHADKTPKDQDEEYRQILKKIRMGSARGAGDALVDTVMSATSTAQKVALIRKAAEGMSAREVQTWLTRAAREDVISDQVRDAAQQALTGTR